MNKSQLSAVLRDESGFGLVEAMMAVTILVIGLLAVSGLSLATASQARVADLRIDQATAAQMAFEQMREDGFTSVSSGVDTVVTGGQTFYVTTVVSSSNSRTKQVTATVASRNVSLPQRSYSTVLHAARPLPTETNPLDP